MRQPDSTFQPHAKLLVFRDRGPTDVAYIAALLGPPDAGGSGKCWEVSSAGLHVARHAVTDHVATVMRRLSGREAAIARLRHEGYWVSVMYFDTTRPDQATLDAISDALEVLDITFDFELE